MIEKKRGQGAGKWNVPGGKVKAEELPELAAQRETEEETGIRPRNLALVGKLYFRFQAGNSWDNDCSVFLSKDFDGALLGETDECRSSWVRISQIPYAKMWQADALWVPHLLAGQWVERKYIFDGADRLVSETILEK